MSKITILVAVYNGEKYLRTCLDSLASQTLEDIQIVCIDDCSTDKSCEIISEYACKDKRFELLKLSTNVGQAKARNKGLELATGEYITMLDCDDWFEPDSLEKVYNAVTSKDDIDCAMFKLMLYHEESGNTDKFINKTDKTILSGEEAFRLSLDWSIHGLYIVRADIHKTYPYDTSCRLYSDDNTTRIHYLHSRKVIISDGEYFYRKHKESMTTACSILRFEYMDANLSMKRQLIEEAKKGNIAKAEEVLNIYEQHRWLNIVDAYWYYYSNKKNFTQSEQTKIEDKIAKMLSSIEKERIAPSLKKKLGYYPFKSYKVFRFVENTYFILRKLKDYLYP